MTNFIYMTNKTSWVLCFQFLLIMIKLNMDTFSTSFICLLTLGCPSLSRLASCPCIFCLKMLHPLFCHRSKQLSVPFFKIFSLCGVLHFQPFFSLDVGRLKLFPNCFVNSSMALECLHLNKVVLLSSLSLTCLLTSLFKGLSDGIKNFSVLVSFDICLDFFFIMFLVDYIHYV